MTLVFAKIIGMFVCGAEPGGRGWGWVFFMKSLQKSILHIYSSLGRVGRCPQLCHDITHTRFVKILLEISSRSRPMGPGPTSITPDFFLKLADSTAFLPQLLSNTITPCAQLEYLREIRPHSIKKSV